MTQSFGILAVGILIGALILLAITHADIAWQYFRTTCRKPRWRIEEVSCNKCTSAKPGYVKAGSFNQATGEMEEAFFKCDRCDGTGRLKVVVHTVDGLVVFDSDEVSDGLGVYAVFTEEEYERYVEDNHG